MEKEIKTPAGKITIDEYGSAELSWNPGFENNVNLGFSKKQAFIDSECLRLCSPLVPFDTGMLEKSGILGTKIGEGELRYIAPYSAKQYYDTAETRPYDPNRGSHWFERMKAAHKAEILKGAKEIE